MASEKAQRVSDGSGESECVALQAAEPVEALLLEHAQKMERLKKELLESKREVVRGAWAVAQVEARRGGSGQREQLAPLHMNKPQQSMGGSPSKWLGMTRSGETDA